MTTILVIDDEEQMRYTLAQVLHINDFTVIEAENGLIGLQKAIDQVPDLILCDVQMTGLDGYDVLDGLRQNPLTASIPFIFLTSLSTSADFRRGMKLGADDYLTKPFGVTELLEAINTRLAKKQTITQPFIQALHQAEDRLNALATESTHLGIDQDKLGLEARMRWGLMQGEFQVYYQPQMDVATGKITGAEALVRWQNPEIGLISPNQFIPLAEESGLIIQLGEWILQTACAQAQQWINMGFSPFKISVNLSPLQFNDPQLINKILRILATTGLAPSNLELEVTEGCLIEDVKEAIDILNALRKIGISIAIDDFGTGYASLTYLRQFPCNTLKIDQSFIRNINEDHHNAIIASAVIKLAHLLNIEVVAEGVENQVELNFLEKEKCDLIQGYFLSRPIPAKEFGQKFIPPQQRPNPVRQYVHHWRYSRNSYLSVATGT